MTPRGDNLNRDGGACDNAHMRARTIDTHVYQHVVGLARGLEQEGDLARRQTATCN